jgi:hypothetical protein
MKYCCGVSQALEVKKKALKLRAKLFGVGVSDRPPV